MQVLWWKVELVGRLKPGVLLVRKTAGMGSKYIRSHRVANCHVRSRVAVPAYQSFRLTGAQDELYT